MNRIILTLLVITVFFGCTELPENTCVFSAPEVISGECQTDSTYHFQLNFKNESGNVVYFDVFDINNNPLGFFSSEDLPVLIENFAITEDDSSTVQICLNDNPDCCEVIRFATLDCSHLECAIGELSLDPMECTGENTYNLHLNFEYENPGNEYFNVLGREDKLIGTYKLADLPVVIENFEGSGNDYDFIKVCINDRPDCCKVAEFEAPICKAECAIGELSLDPMECTGENTYNLHLNFEYENPGNEYFNVLGREDKLIGTYKLADLPVVIENFEGSGNDYDFIKVCINDRPDCCKVAEFPAPVCKSQCEISELTVTKGECVTDSTYSITINFTHTNASNDLFEVWGRDNHYYGYFNLNELPLTIREFKKSGRDYDLVKVCINDNPDCCKATEIISPGCDD